ncbi:EVE domain-containing protein [Marinobacter nanhaiticus D15-8W]|uniref:EVE domain-containing protein n=1 Tax=Marinobacter nanhaiticus D15-8W TaxID=626887 RepID=N6X5D1_9GAMM|nr:EVE domain-containing protein [Marinobacter nanhaiticus]ENO16288.1 EVE domain-containing protein [Marinobacter nanhaiticus D15-8W]BES72854.1 EVE domain-containing protein [Marinobacter nanhaiticus D15-8W]
MAYWLVKSEPDECGIDDFARAPDEPIAWDGVRNYQARNFLAEMDEGDRVFMYHSSCKLIGIAGVIRVVRAAYPDPTQFDEQSPYFDAKSSPEKPRWKAVDMVFERKFDDVIPLQRLKEESALADLPLVKKGARLSVMPVTESQWNHILSMVGS